MASPGSWEELTLTCLCDGAGTRVQPEIIYTQEGNYSSVDTATRSRSECVMLLSGALVTQGEWMRHSCATRDFKLRFISLSVLES